MHVHDVLVKKRDGGELTAEEITFFVRGVVDGSIPDYQASAWLMAVFLRGMTRKETLDLTLAMRDSGKRLDLSGLANGPALDKHSTGGVGDKTTLVVIPILAAAGVPMLKMSGRGLGFSGGTIDKLEAIPGFRTELSIAEALAQVECVGAALIAQTGDLAPADKILYALRDVTATIECIPLIASSIMSKKLAAGAQRIVLDVKVGRGSFMKTLERATELARELVEIGVGAGVPTTAVLTAMEEPLGYAIGNAIEVEEAIHVLQGHFAEGQIPKYLNTQIPEYPNTRIPEYPVLQGQGHYAEGSPWRRASLPFRALCLDLAAEGLVAVGKAPTLEAGRAQAMALLDSGAAANKFAEIVAAQGGPNTCEAILSALPSAPIHHNVTAETTGVVAAIDAEAIGRLAVLMGAGRLKKSDLIDPAVSIHLHLKTGAEVAPGATLATLNLRTPDAARAEEFAATLRAAYHISPASETSPPPPPSLILGTIP